MTDDLEVDARTPQAEWRHTCSHPDLDRRDTVNCHVTGCDVSREPIGKRTGDLLAGACYSVRGLSIDGRGVPRALCRCGGEGVAHMQNETDLDESEHQRHQDQADQDEVDDRSAVVSP